MNTFNYGVIGNCRTAALISEKASIDWLCMPDFDSPSVFAKLLDKDKGGCFGFIVDDTYLISQTYKAHTNVLCTSFVSPEGAFDVIDFMPRYRIDENNSHYIPSEIYRLIKHKGGKPRFRIDFRPAMSYASEKHEYLFFNDYFTIICSRERPARETYNCQFFLYFLFVTI